MNITAVTVAASQYGLIVRGSFAVATTDNIPSVNGRPAKSLLLFGNAGSSMWESFSNSDEYRDGDPDPLNRWSARVGNAIAQQFGAVALFPFGGPPHLPFLRWGKRAEGLRNSQIGMLMHPRFGLWHAYRFALAFADAIDVAHGDVHAHDDATDVAHDDADAADISNLCTACDDKPCLRACPVDAFSADGYDVQSCYRYLESNPDSRCMREGCQARVACPQGAAHRYQHDHAAFHMRTFVTAMAAQELADNPHAPASKSAR